MRSWPSSEAPEAARTTRAARTVGGARLLLDLDRGRPGDHRIAGVERAGDHGQHLGVAAVGDAGADLHRAQLVLLVLGIWVEDVDGLPLLPAAAAALPIAGPLAVAGAAASRAAHPRPPLAAGCALLGRPAARGLVGAGPRTAAPAAAAGLLLAAFRRGLRPEAQRRVGHAQHVLHAGDVDGDVGRHAGAQLEVGVRHLDDHRIGDDVLGDGGVQPHLGDLPPEGLVGVGVDGEVRRLAGLDLADVRLVDVSLDLHLGEVLGDGEQGGGRERGGDRLADVVLAGHHLTVDRRVDLGVAEVGLRLLQSRLGLGEPGERAVIGRLGGVEVGLRDQAGVGQPLLAVVGDLGARHLDLRLGDVGPALLDGLLEGGGIELGEELPLLDLAVEVGVEPGDDARDLAADLDRGDGREGPRGIDGRRDAPRADRLGAVLVAALLLAATEKEKPDQDPHHHDDGDDEEPALLVIVLEWVHVVSERGGPGEVSRIARSPPIFYMSYNYLAFVAYASPRGARVLQSRF